MRKAKNLQQILEEQVQRNVDHKNYEKAVLQKVKIRTTDAARAKIYSYWIKKLTVEEAAEKLRRCE